MNNNIKTEVFRILQNIIIAALSVFRQLAKYRNGNFHQNMISVLAIKVQQNLPPEVCGIRFISND